MPRETVLAAWPWLIIAAATTVVLIVAVVSRPIRRLTASTRAALGASTIRHAWLAGGPLAILATLSLPSYLSTPGQATWSVLVMLGTALTALLMPASVASLVSLVGRVFQSAGRRAGIGSLLTAGAWLRHRTLAWLGQIAVVVVAGILLSQTMIYTQLFDGPAGEAIRAQRETGGRVVTLTGAATKGQAQVSALREDDATTSLVRFRFDRGGWLATGDCASLRVLDLPCRSGARVHSPTLDRNGVDFLGGSLPLISVEPIRDLAMSDVLLISAPSPVDLPAFNQFANRHFAGAPSAQLTGSSYLSGARDLEQKGRWVTLFALLGSLAAGSAALLTSSVVMSELVRRLVPVAVLTSRRAATTATLAVVCAVPLVLAATGALLSAALVAQPSMADTEALSRPTLAPYVIAAAVVLFAVSFAGAVKGLSTAASRWLPGRDT